MAVLACVDAVGGNCRISVARRHGGYGEIARLSSHRSPPHGRPSRSVEHSHQDDGWLSQVSFKAQPSPLYVDYIERARALVLKANANHIARTEGLILNRIEFTVRKAATWAIGEINAIERQFEIVVQLIACRN
jgi:hypothetical protein